MNKLAYSLTEASAATGLSKSHFDRAIRLGDLKAKKSSRDDKTGEPAGKFVILGRDLEAYLDGLADA